MSTALRTGWLVGILCFSLAEAATARNFYRYVNDQGVKVINHQIPPEYAQRGYEIVTARGEVLKVVPPAPSPEEAAKMERQMMREEELAKWDAELKRRYSSVSDIEAAKQRKLVQVNSNISILRSNIRTIKAQISEQHARAANSERLGREVPKMVLDTLAGLEKELKLTEEQVAQREQQYQEIVQKFERDKDRFRIIRPGRN
ncbi:hypothetical protein HBA55_24485 [Pseudomaricurvus alkylphenolicus]|jgi:hypothetical protein|uniref:hypothetical protein n=1 Tax=Pseudomaricurvus alkylphenolicus TaxID=1306991 RepID=UPI001422BDD0|nr:hypothetical protein [Pseudomaricurvus alkylphenolicus]NIB42787.1 hypothetical protein [Pseudomaricurvus alkylphenolicus]